MKSRAPSRTLMTGNYWNHNSIHRRSLRTNCYKKNLKHRNHLHEYGLWFDYPSCCIESFSRVWRNIEDLPYQQRIAINIQIQKKVFKQIPCLKCSRKYLRSVSKKTHQMTLRD